MTKQNPRRLPAVEPHWPTGTVAHIYVTTKATTPTVDVEELAISRVTATPHGYRIVAEGTVYDVDRNGESAECVPWDGLIDMQYGKEHGLAAREEARRDAEAVAAMEFGL